MRIDVSIIKKGLFIKTSTINPRCEDYGPLKVTGVKITNDKYDTNWYGHTRRKGDIIDRQTIHIHYENQSGHKGVHRYWLDEFSNPNSTFPDIHILSANDWKEAKKESLIIDARYQLDRAYKAIELELKDQYKTIAKYAPVLNGKHTEIADKIEELIELI